MATCMGLRELGIDREEIDAMLISHFHGDHFGGIPAFLLAAEHEDQRKRPLRIAGPPGIELRVQYLAEAMGYLASEREWSFPLEFEELPAGSEVGVGPLAVRSFEAHHQEHTKPHGLIVSAGSQRIAYSGDTGWFDGLAAQVAGADLFVTECTYHTNDFEYHINYQDLCAREREFDCGPIILTHLGKDMTDRRGQCAFETADDGLVIQI
jgi:ribonuclease BN (tRNA processing enzyme)